MPAARNVAIPHAVACRFPCRSAWAKTASEAAAASAVTITNSPKLSRYTGVLGLRDRAQELVDREGGERLQLRASTRAERDRDLGDRRGIGRLHDVDEVERAERRPLVQHLGAELLDVAVDLPQPVGVRLERLNPLCGERRQHDVGRHRSSFFGMLAGYA